MLSVKTGTEITKTSTVTPNANKGRKGRTECTFAFFSIVTKVLIEGIKKGKMIMTCLPFIGYQKLYFSQEKPSGDGKNIKIMLGSSHLRNNVLKNP